MEPDKMLSENKEFTLEIRVAGATDDKLRASLYFPVTGKIALQVINFTNEKINQRISGMKRKADQETD